MNQIEADKMFSGNLAKNVLMETSKEIERGRERERRGETSGIE